MSRILKITLSTLTLCAASVPTMAAPDAYSDRQNPNAITCQVRPVEGMAHVKDKVCKRNSEWARMNGGSRFAGPEPGLPTMPATP
jgi:hypothetical protein